MARTVPLLVGLTRPDQEKRPSAPRDLNYSNVRFSQRWDRSLYLFSLHRCISDVDAAAWMLMRSALVLSAPLPEGLKYMKSCRAWGGAESTRSWAISWQPTNRLQISWSISKKAEASGNVSQSLWKKNNTCWNHLIWLSRCRWSALSRSAADVNRDAGEGICTWNYEHTGLVEQISCVLVIRN